MAREMSWHNGPRVGCSFHLAVSSLENNHTPVPLFEYHIRECIQLNHIFFVSRKHSPHRSSGALAYHRNLSPQQSGRKPNMSSVSQTTQPACTKRAQKSVLYKGVARPAACAVCMAVGSQSTPQRCLSCTCVWTEHVLQVSAVGHWLELTVNSGGGVLLITGA